MTLPPLLLLTDRRQATAPLPSVVAEAVEAGVRAVVLRELDLPPVARAELAASLGPLVHQAGGLLISAHRHVPGCDGVHLPSGRPAMGDRTSRPQPSMTGWSCHDAVELAASEAAGADYVTLSPVFRTASKPGYGPPLGIDGLARLVAGTAVPVYALGGVDTPTAGRACRHAGAHGVAVMGSIMRSERPGRLVRRMLLALSAGEAA